MTDFTATDYAVLPYLSMNDGAGVYSSPHGHVQVLVQQPERCGKYRYHGFTGLGFIRNGRAYHRTWDRAWPLRTISRLAREFADDVARD